MKKIIAFLLVLILNISISFAGDIDVSKLPKLLGSNNMGKEFYFTFLPVWTDIPKATLYIYVSSSNRTKITVEIPGRKYSDTVYTVPNENLVFRLSPSLGQAYWKYITEPPYPDSVWNGIAIHIVAEDPIICYALTRFEGNSEGFLVLPVNQLGTDYIISSWEDAADGTTQWLSSYASVVAVNNNTKIKFTMGGNDSSKTANGLIAGQYSEWDLNSGDVFLVGSTGYHGDLTGSIIHSSKPVAVISGNSCANVPTEYGICRTLEEMELPTYAWSTSYHVTPIYGRKKNSMIRIFAKEPNTRIYRNGDPIGFLKESGGLEGKGWMSIRADTGSPKPLVIVGDKPIGITQYNTGESDDNVPGGPFQMGLIPTELYQNEIAFNTPGFRGGVGFPYNYINIIYETNMGSLIPDDIEIYYNTYQDSVMRWHKLNESLAKSAMEFPHDIKEKHYAYTTFLLPSDGVYKLKANRKFQAYSYGFSSLDSYGFPASILLDSVKYEKPDYEVYGNELIIYPNPANDLLHIYSKDKILNIDIFDFIGRQYQCQPKEHYFEKVIDISNLTYGFYIVKVETNKGLKFKTFIK